MAYEKFTTSCSFVSLVEGEKNLLRLYRYMFLSEKDDGYYETSSFESDTLELKDDNGKLNICFNVATTAHLKCKPKLMPIDVETKQETKNRNIRFQRTFSDGVLHYPKTFGFAYTSLSFFGILYCVMIPILFDQPFILNEGHCEHQNVDNFFPWVSHAIIYSPHTKTIWSLCVLLNSPILFALAKHLNTKYHHLFEAYARSNADTLGKREIAFYHSLLNVVYLLNNVQVISLLLLTLFGAKSFWDIHFLAAVTLFVSMCIFSVFVCIVEAKLRPIKILKCFPIEIDFFKFRVILTTIFLISILLALVFYIWFSCFCTDYVYSLFGLFELISSVSLLLFHSLTYVLVEDLPTQIERLKAH